MAHIVASITVLVNTAIITAKVRHCKRKSYPDALFHFAAENGGQRVMFSGIFMSYPQ